MSTANRLKHKKKLPTDSQPRAQNISSPTFPNTTNQNKPQAKYDENAHTQQKEQQYESYYQISKCNPNGVLYTHSLFPQSAQMHNNYNVPLGFVLSPLLALQNEQSQAMAKTADKIPRCENCRAYMNCYNRIQKKKFTCFLCNRETRLEKQYSQSELKEEQFNSSIYQAFSPTNFYQKEPSQETYVFMIDISPQSANTKMLYYAVAAMKQVLARPQLDDICIYFFTFDQLVQQYDFSGQDIKCVINDQSIDGKNTFNGESYLLKQIREKLFILLDALQQISQKNQRKGSNFAKTFDYIFTSLKQTSAKFFILQANQAIGGEPIFKEEMPKATGGQTQKQKVVSLFETYNKSFFEKYVNQLLNNECSLSYFTFSRTFKNLRAIHDPLKLSSSDIKIYFKDSESELQRFYYQFSYLIGATYFKNLRLDCIISFGWHFTAVYGNFYRLKEFITFQMNWLQSSRKIIVLVAPSNSVQVPPPYCCFQLITNYQYKRQSYISVATIVQPVTGYYQRLYDSIDTIAASCALARGFLSSLRMQQLTSARKKLTQNISNIYLSALSYYKKSQNIPDQIISLAMSSLSMLKSIHSQPQQINNSLMFDKVISQRNFLQFSSQTDLYNYFNPYLFNLTNLDQQACQEGEGFIYPQTIQIKFQNVKEGLFLLDAGLAIYLFIARQCDPNLLQEVFGKPKLSKNDQLNQEVLSNQESWKAIQIQNLIRTLRQQKSYGWVPLYIVRCGENSLHERNFYLFFYGQKYQQFRLYKLNIEEFLALLSKPNSF